MAAEAFNLNAFRLAKADEIVRRIDTVTLVKVSEVEDIRRRALAGEFDNLELFDYVVDQEKQEEAAKHCLHPPRGLNAAPHDGKAVHPHDDNTWWFHDETWMYEYGPYPSQEVAEEKCTAYAAQL